MSMFTFQNIKDIQTENTSEKLSYVLLIKRSVYLAYNEFWNGFNNQRNNDDYNYDDKDDDTHGIEIRLWTDATAGFAAVDVVVVVNGSLLLTVHENTRWMSFYGNCNNIKINLKYILSMNAKTIYLVLMYILIHIFN